MDFYSPPLLPLQRHLLPLPHCLQEVNKHPLCPISRVASRTYPEPPAPPRRSANTINLPADNSFISCCPKPAHPGVIRLHLRVGPAFDVFWASKLKV